MTKTIQLSGIVSAESGEPIPSASVQISDLQSTVAAWTLTDAAGVYSFSLGLALVQEEVKFNVIAQVLGFEGRSTTKHTDRDAITANFKLSKIE